MESAFDLNTRIFLSMSRQLPYGDKSPRMDFFEAAFNGDLGRLREMARGKDAEGKAQLAEACVGGQGPLQAAARLGRLDVLRCLVEELGFDVNGGSKDYGITALAAAALDGKLEAVRYLLDNGADPNKKDDSGSVPLHCAAKNGHDEVARLLLSRGASVDVAYFHGTPLHIAAAYGKPSVMKVLLERHADPNKISEELGTPLVATLHATAQGLTESIILKCVKLLVEAGADVNSTDPDTPLVVATAHSLTDCIKYLLKAGGDPNIHSDSGLLPIQIAACQGSRRVVEILFPFTAPVQIVSNWSVEGILAHVKAIHSKAKFEQSGKRTKAKLKKHINAEPKKPTQGEPKKPTQAEQKKPTQVEPKKPAQAEPKKPIQAEQKKPTQAELKNPAKAGLKLNGDEAVGRKDYLAASKLYSEAIDLDPNDATLYSNRSLCHLKIGEATKALFDANTCIKMRPEWLKGYYRKGAALMSLKEYKGACDAFMAGLKRDPNNGEMEKMFRQAVEAMKKEHAARKNLDSID